MTDREKKLAEARAKLDAATKALADMTAKAANPGATTVTVGVTSPELAAQIAGMQKTIGELEAAQRARPVAGAAATVEVPTPTAKNVSFAKMLLKTDRRRGGQGLTIFDAKGWEDAPNELAALRKGAMDKHAPHAKTWAEAEPVVKAMSFQDTASAGGLVPVTLMSEIVPPNRSKDLLPSLGVSVKSGLRGVVEWNRRISGTTFRPVSENPSSAPTADDLAYTKIQLTPREFIGFCKLSNKLMQQAGSVIESEIRDDLGGAWLESRNSNVLAGTGVGGYPLGILARTTGTTQSTVQTVAVSGDIAAVWPKLWNMRAAIRVLKNDVTNLKFAMHPTDWSDVCRVTSASTTSAAAGTAYPPLFNAGDPSKGVAPMLIGYPVVECDELTEGTIILGDFSQVYWGEWSGVSLAMSDVAGNAFEYNQTYVRMIYDCDVAIAKPSALCTGTSFSV